MTKRNVWDRIRTAFKANDEAALNEELEAAQKAYDEEEGENTHRLVIEMKPAEPAAKPEEETKDDGEEGDPMAAALQPIMEALAAISARLDKSRPLNRRKSRSRPVTKKPTRKTRMKTRSR